MRANKPEAALQSSAFHFLMFYYISVHLIVVGIGLWCVCVLGSE